MTEIHSYEYVVLPYDRVRDELRAEPAAFLAQKLHASVGPLDVGVDVEVKVAGVGETVNAIGDRQTWLEIVWSAAGKTGLFPVMEATISVYALSAHETQIDLQGRYDPPAGIVGSAVDAAFGHRVAAESATRFVKDLCDRLRARIERKVPA